MCHCVMTFIGNFPSDSLNKVSLLSRLPIYNSVSGSTRKLHTVIILKLIEDFNQNVSFAES